MKESFEVVDVRHLYYVQFPLWWVFSPVKFEFVRVGSLSGVGYGSHGVRKGRPSGGSIVRAVPTDEKRSGDFNVLLRETPDSTLSRLTL